MIRYKKNKVDRRTKWVIEPMFSDHKRQSEKKNILKQNHETFVNKKYSLIIYFFVFLTSGVYFLKILWISFKFSCKILKNFTGDCSWPCCLEKVRLSTPAKILYKVCSCLQLSKFSLNFIIIMIKSSNTIINFWKKLCTF